MPEFRCTLFNPYLVDAHPCLASNRCQKKNDIQYRYNQKQIVEPVFLIGSNNGAWDIFASDWHVYHTFQLVCHDRPMKLQSFAPLQVLPAAQKVPMHQNTPMLRDQKNYSLKLSRYEYIVAMAVL